MRARIGEATIERVGGELPSLVGGAGHRARRREGLVVRLRDERGAIGLGEASPLPGYSPDAIEQCAHEIAAVDWDDAIECTMMDVDSMLVDRIGHWLDRAGPRAPAARFAVETGLLDLAGRRAGLPLGRLLATAPRSHVPLSAVIDLGDRAGGEAALERARARGISTVKCKVGAPGGWREEMDALRTLRRAGGDSLRLRVDANRAFAPEVALARLAELAAIGVDLVEEPLAGGLAGWLAQCAELQSLEPLPALAADETMMEPGGLNAIAPWIARGIIRAVVLKPTVLGGLGACLALGRRAAALGASLVVTHTWDGPIALAAACALALALPGRVLDCGLDRHPGLAVFPSIALPCLTDSAVIATESPGLGLELPR